MERLVTVKDIRERYGCSGPTARKYLRQMFHYENPLAAPQWAFDEWEQSRERMPADITGARYVDILNRKEHGTCDRSEKEGLTMTRKEMEMTLIHMMKGIVAFVKMYDQNINHINFYTLDKCLDFRAVHEEDGKDDVEILSCHVFDDGSMRVDGVYYNADGSIDFVPMKVSKEVSA